MAMAVVFQWNGNCDNFRVYHDSLIQYLVHLVHRNASRRAVPFFRHVTTKTPVTRFSVSRQSSILVILTIVKFCSELKPLTHRPIT